MSHIHYVIFDLERGKWVWKKQFPTLTEARKFAKYYSEKLSTSGIVNISVEGDIAEYKNGKKIR